MLIDTALRKDKYTKILTRVVNLDDLCFLYLVPVFLGFQH